MENILPFFKTVLRDYAKRFWVFWPILYLATVLLELSRQVFLENSTSIAFLKFAPQLFSNRLLEELLVRPYLVLPLLAAFLFNAWGFGSLYFAFRDSGFWGAVRLGFKNLHRYVGYVVVASLITLIGFILLPGLVVWALDAFTDLPVYLPNGETPNPWLVLPLALVLGIPGMYFLVAFANGPFILLLENRGMFQSLRESVRRVTPKWFIAAVYLLASLIIAGIAYYALSWLIFTLKLAFIPNLSLRGESMLRVFLYSISWVIVASFYDLALYHVYRRFSGAGAAEPDARMAQKAKLEHGPGVDLFALFSSPAILKVVSTLVLVAFVFNFVLVPIPVQAGGLFGGGNGLFGIFTTIAIVATCIVAGCAGAFILGATMMLGLAGGIAATVIVVGLALHSAYTLAKDIEGLVNGCSGDYDPVFGGCTRRSGATQEIQVSNNIKFTDVLYPDIPTAKDYAANPDAQRPVTIKWQAEAQPGLVNYFRILDKNTNQYLDSKCSPTGNVCSAGPQTTVCELPYEKEFRGEIWLASCWQVSAKEVRPTCSGCGGDVWGVRTDITTPPLPLPKADIKADGKDGNVVFKSGVPVKISWTSEYALSCEASGSWSGVKATSGSETVIAKGESDVYTLVCRRGDKSGQDSVSAATAKKQLQIFDPGGGGGASGGGGGGFGKLRISWFNSTEPLNPGDTVTIAWSVAGAESCEVDNGIGKIPTVGSVDVKFFRTITFTLTCHDDGGNSVSAKHTVDVKTIPGVKEIKPE